MSPRGLAGVARDYAFFRLCGIRSLAGVPVARGLRSYRPREDGSGLWESEARRLVRCIEPIVGPGRAEVESWDLRLSPGEIAEADAELGAAFQGAAPTGFLVMSIGTKQSIKDWGDDNWRAVLKAISRPHRGLVLIGAAAERERSESLVRAWAGPVANLCGRTSPRVSAAAMRHARVFLGHDSGPMHLAAAVGTRCVVVFSKKNRPGEWFPCGRHHVVFYPPPDATSIAAIRPPDVSAAAERVLFEVERDVSATMA
jgi:ADP-heptose:LPS heptosyltransferase